MRHYTTPLLARAVACLLTLAPLAAPAIEPQDLLAALDSITIEELKKHVDFLADDALEGREAGARGGRAAGNFVMQYLEKQGLKPAGDSGTWFQGFNGSCRNVLAWKEGSDPVLKNELIILSAHYDHVGYGNAANSYGPFGYVHNGADDNASGVAGLMEVIDAIQKMPTAPKRSILFAFWDSEEKGLDGSKAWVARPTLAGKRTRLAVNVDMIGRMRQNFVEVYGTRTGAGLRELVSRSNGDELDLDFTWVMREDSDHYTFFKAGIPSLMLHTGLHDNYHRPSDDVQLLNFEGMRQVTRCLLELGLNAADAPRLPEFRRASLTEAGSREGSLPPVPAIQPRMGVTWRPTTVAGEPAMEVSIVTPGLPAERAGLRVGDRLVTFNGRPIGEDKPLRVAILAAEGTVTLRVARTGQEEPVEIPIALQGRPIRIGVMWREDEAEPATATLTNVVPGSAAANAGLKLRDRVVEVNGERFSNSAELDRLISDVTQAPRITFERRGRLYSVDLELAP